LSLKVLGISALYHDSAAALLVDGLPTAAAQEERFSRTKNDPAFPLRAIDFCLKQGDLTSADLDAVVFYDKPLVKLDRLLNTTLARAPRGYANFRVAMPAWLREKLWVPKILKRELPGAGDYLYAQHHQSHAASAFYPSPFEQAAILTLDGVGEWATCAYGVGSGAACDLLAEQHFPHSLGLLYSAFTAYLGFRVNEGEYKVMGLAPYGTPRYLDRILGTLLRRHRDGVFELNTAFFSFLDRPRMTNSSFWKLFEGEPRLPAAPLEQRHMDIAASIQRAVEILVLDLAGYVFRETGEKNLCLAGGVALNCVANGRLLREGPFENLWIQPASGDAGGALGAAFAGHVALGGALPEKDGSHDLMSGALLGPEYKTEEIFEVLKRAGVRFEKLETPALLQKVASALEEGDVVGWFQGRMEFGPRALGCRSILADARIPEMQQTLNQKIKFREGFRPFAPVVLAERAGEYFDLAVESPYMLLVTDVAEEKRLRVDSESVGLDKLKIKRSVIPAVTHVDGSARVQTAGETTNPLLRDLLTSFAVKTGCPLLVNTSFNVRDEPIVCSPEDAVKCFLSTGMDGLAIGPFWVQKEVF
jgi:carbamoyltransferase